MAKVSAAAIGSVYMPLITGEHAANYLQVARGDCRRCTRSACCWAANFATVPWRQSGRARPNTELPPKHVRCCVARCRGSFAQVCCRTLPRTFVLAINVCSLRSAGRASGSPPHVTQIPGWRFISVALSLALPCPAADGRCLLGVLAAPALRNCAVHLWYGQGVNDSATVSSSVSV